MTQLIRTTCGLCAAAALSAAGAEPPCEIVEVTVPCTSAEAAQRAEWRSLPLPPGKKIAVSSRWDDTNAKHLRMRNLLAKYHWHATFYPNRWNEEFEKQVLPQLCTGGFSVGNHTVTHPRLPSCYPNRIFFEIMEQRVALEAATNQVVTAFVLPYVDADDAFFPGSGKIIGSALRRAGMLGGGEHQAVDPVKCYQMEPGKYFGSRWVYPGDVNPLPEKFDAVIRAEQIPGADGVTHMTLGIHSWHTEEGFANLEKSLKRYADNPEWWYCNENEYIAYRYTAANARVVGKRVDGSSAIFRLALPLADEVGGNPPLWGEIDGKTVQIVRHSRLPEKIGRCDADGKSGKFPDLTARLVLKKEALPRLEVENAGTPLTDIRLTWHLPFLTAQETVRQEAKEITGKAAFVPEASIQKESVRYGQEYFACRIDFMRDGKPGRLWVTECREIPAPAPEFPVRYSTKARTKEEWLAVSRSNQPLPDDFRAAQSESRWRREYLAFPQELWEKAKAGETIAFAVDFSGAHTVEFAGSYMDAVYLNGVAQPFPPRRVVTLQSQAGPNRLIVVFRHTNRVAIDAKLRIR